MYIFFSNKKANNIKGFGNYKEGKERKEAEYFHFLVVEKMKFMYSVGINSITLNRNRQVP